MRSQAHPVSSKSSTALPRHMQSSPKDVPKHPQDAPERPPGGPKRHTRSGPEAAKRGQETPQESPKAAPDANTTKSVTLTTFSRKFVVFRWSGLSKMAENCPPNVPRRKKIAQETPREQMEAKVRSKTRPEPPNRREQAAKWARQVLTVLWCGYFQAPAAAG